MPILQRHGRPVYDLIAFDPNHPGWTDTKRGLTLFDASQLRIYGPKVVREKWQQHSTRLAGRTEALIRYQRGDGKSALIPARLEIDEERMRVRAYPETTPNDPGLVWGEHRNEDLQ